MKKNRIVIARSLSQYETHGYQSIKKIRQKLYCFHLIILLLIGSLTIITWQKQRNMSE
jgi:hypothetical protein